MIDFNSIIKHEDSVRKAKLLKNLKTSYESLIFDRGSQSQWNNNFNFNFNGTISIFCRNIQEILLDGILKPPHTLSIQILWSLVISILFEQDDTSNSAKEDFKLIFKQIETQNSQDFVFDWILNSLRQRSLLKQIDFILKSCLILKNQYLKNSFILDVDFKSDFLLYIKAFELNNPKYLSKCKLNLYAILNQHINDYAESSLNDFDANTISQKSSVLDLTSMSSSPLYLIESPKEFGPFKTNTNKINQHRRIHSFPNIQINLFKKSNPIEALSSSVCDQIEEQTSSKQTQTTVLVPRITLNDESQTECKEVVSNDTQDTDYSKTSIFEFINQIEINSESSLLDKENSHFLLADLAISSIELIKTQKNLLNKPEAEIQSETQSLGKTLKSSSSIKINNKSVSIIHNIESFEDTSSVISSSFNSPQPFQTIFEKVYPHVDDSNLVKSLSSSLLTDDSTQQLNKSNSLTELNIPSNKTQRQKHENWVLKNDKVNSNESNLRGSFEAPGSLPSNNGVLNEDGFEIVDSTRSRSRSRKFSWEDINKLETAGSISSRLINKMMRDDKQVHIPNLGQYDFFLKFLQYQELMQHYYFNQSNNPKPKKALSLSLLDQHSPNLSASSIYLSHLEAPSKKMDKKRLSVISIQSQAIPQPSSSSYQRVKSAAFSLLQNINSKRLFKQESNGRILGDDLWAPVREQLILNLSPKQKRIEQIRQQHFRCADCGVYINQDNKELKTFNYCEYFCKYFCKCCHKNQTSYIPAYVVNLLDFRTTFEVSKKANNFLEKIYNEPLITLESLNSSLFMDNTNIFSKIKKLRFKLYNCRSYINTCRFAQDLKIELYTRFDDFIFNDQHVYSMDTLFKIKKMNYCEQLRLISNKIIEHIKSCELCSQQGYLCGLCHRKDLLYPFDMDKVEKCPNCLACYHKTCFRSPDHCPRCIRKRNRLNVL